MLLWKQRGLHSSDLKVYSDVVCIGFVLRKALYPSVLCRKMKHPCTIEYILSMENPFCYCLMKRYGNFITGKTGME